MSLTDFNDGYHFEHHPIPSDPSLDTGKEWWHHYDIESPFDLGKSKEGEELAKSIIMSAWVEWELPDNSRFWLDVLEYLD